MGKVVKSEVVKTTNIVTGEIIENETKEIISYGRTEDFVMTFTKDLGYLKNLSKGEILVVMGFLKVVNRENEVILNKTIKERIAKEFDLNISSMNQLISNLVKKKVIQNKERGVYILNTFLFGKGDWTNVKKLRMEIEWDFQKLTKNIQIEQIYLSTEEQKILQNNTKNENECKCSIDSLSMGH